MPDTTVKAKTPIEVAGTVSASRTPVNFIYVMDTSWGAGAESDCADENSDGASTVLDCEISGLTAMNAINIEADAEVSLVTFHSRASVHDVDPSTAGIQVTAQPDSDADGNGRPDIVDALRSAPSEPGGCRCR